MNPPFLDEILAALGIDAATVKAPTVTGEGNLPSFFPVTDLAVATIAAAGLAVANLLANPGDEPIAIDRRLASFWFGMSIRPIGWKQPSPWDPLGGDYAARDGWIRLHTNASHHRAAALSVLGNCTERDEIASAVAGWDRIALESAIVDAGGCAAAMNTLDDWRKHPQGEAVASEPLIAWREHGQSKRRRNGSGAVPLQGVRILDLTRILAGPVAGRFLAAYGADVLRIDPPLWEEPAAVPEVTLGKRCARLDLHRPEDRAVFEGLVAGADVLLHGYRADALERLGYDGSALRGLNPSLIDIALDAYGWSGPWALRRGFDSLVQMSAGLANHAMRQSGASKPVSLPVQALDQGAGYLLAAALAHALSRNARSGDVVSARLSLAGVANLLARAPLDGFDSPLEPETANDIDPQIENTPWGPAQRVRFPLRIPGAPHGWPYPASELGSSPPAW